MTRRPRLLVVSQYYWPGVEATARLLTQLCEGLATELDITVVTGCLRSHSEHAERVVRGGVTIVRVPSTTFERSTLVLRAANYVTFLGSSLWVGLRVGRPDLVLCMTDPPLVASVAHPIARRYGVPLVIIVQDVFPEIAVELRRLDQPLLIGLLRRTIEFSLTRADTVVAIGETMRERLTAKGTRPERIVVIPNWADTAEIKPMPRDNEWGREHGLMGRFVVMHSGNVGYAQDLETLVRATTLLRDLDDLAVALVGSGARQKALGQLAERLEADAVRFFPYQPLETLSHSLSSADVHFVGLAQGLAGFVVPSRLYGIMAAAKAVIVSAEPESETARLVSDIECGVVIPPGRADLVAKAIRELRDAPSELEAMGRRGLDYVRSDGDRRVAVDRYRRLLASLTGRS